MRVSALRLSFIVFMMLFLSIIPLTPPLHFFRPLWLLLLVIYLRSTVPKQSSVMFIMLLGLILDAMGAGALGLHAFALLLTAYFVSKRALRFRLFSMSQQLFGIVAFSCLYQAVLLLIQILWGYPVSIGAVLGPIVMSVLCWPWLQYLGDRLFFPPVR
ncbi:MAG: rod shape-determining protein MreD [Legionella sp.]|nr:rod shape-determining protein MreD [Legionella sp.]